MLAREFFSCNCSSGLFDDFIVTAPPSDQWLPSTCQVLGAPAQSCQSASESGCETCGAMPNLNFPQLGTIRFRLLPQNYHYRHCYYLVGNSRLLSRIGVMIRGSDAGSATVVRPTTAKLSRPQIMDPSWSLNIDMTTIQLSTLEEVETVLTKPRRLHLQATVAAATKKRGGRKSVARPLGNNSSTNKKITSNKIPVAVDFLPQE
ncbi:unnamed protein product, partial [Nesidiocoris tenuis]